MQKHAILTFAVAVVAGAMLGCEPNTGSNARELGLGQGVNPGDDGIRRTTTTSHNDPILATDGVGANETETRPDLRTEDRLDRIRGAGATVQGSPDTDARVGQRGGSLNSNATPRGSDGTTSVGGSRDVDRTDRRVDTDRNPTAGDSRVVDDRFDRDRTIIRDSDRVNDDARQAGDRVDSDRRRTEDRIEAGDSRTQETGDSINRTGAAPRNPDGDRGTGGDGGGVGNVPGDPGAAGGPSSVDRTRGNSGSGAGGGSE